MIRQKFGLLKPTYRWLLLSHECPASVDKGRTRKKQPHEASKGIGWCLFASLHTPITLSLLFTVNGPFVWRGLLRTIVEPVELWTAGHERWTKIARNDNNHLRGLSVSISIPRVRWAAKWLEKKAGCIPHTGFFEVNDYVIKLGQESSRSSIFLQLKQRHRHWTPHKGRGRAR